MTTTLKKLKIGKGSLTGESVVGYLVDPQDVGDYYTEDSEAFLTWLATDRARLLFALGDDVSRGTLKNLIEGIDPITGQLFRRYGPDGTMVGAIDLTVSPAPKSVSILWALADDELKYEIEEMVMAAVAAAVGRMLREQPLTRERYGPGPRDVAPAIAKDWVGARVMHTAARLSANSDGVPDPQLHVHNLLIGAVDERGRLRALDSLPIMRYKAELDAEAQGHLAEMLRQRGFLIDRHLEERRNGQPWSRWELAGIAPSLIRAMSSRTAEIEDLQRKYTDLYGREPTGPAWEAWIALQRGPKGKLSSVEMFTARALEAERHGFDLNALEAMRAAADRARAAGIQPRAERSPEAAEFRRLMLQYVCREFAFVPFAQMERLARQLAVGLLAPRVADAVIADMIEDGDLLVTNDEQVTTLEVLRYEQRARAATAQLLAAPPDSPVAQHLIDAELQRRSEEGAPLDERQAEAVRLATSGARFVSIAGPAGTGKGHASAAMGELWHVAGRRVIAAAVAGLRAQRAAADADADEAMNIDLLLTRLEHGVFTLRPGDVVLIDEAAIVDHARYAPLLERAAHAGATVVQLGDDKQLSPIGPGGLWTTTHRMAEAQGLAVELDVIHRARHKREAQAWGDLRHGRVAEALAWMRDERRLLLYETRPELLAGMVADWWTGNPDGLMVVDTSNAERDRLNDLAQAQRLAAGDLGAETLRLDGGLQVHRGDRVLFNNIYRPVPPPGQRRVAQVENGTPALVVELDVDRRRMVLDLHEGDDVRRLEVGTDAPLELGYARHVMKAQGVTHEDTDLAVSLQTRRNQLYVMATRARAGARFHAVAAELAEGAMDLVGDRGPGGGEDELAVTPMTAAQEAVLEAHDLTPDPAWTWVDASLRIDVALGTPVGRQAQLWLEANGHSPEDAARLISEARERQSRPEAPAEPPEMTPMTEAQEALLQDRGVSPDPEWTWVQASLQIDAVLGTPLGQQAEQWLQEHGHSPESAASIVDQARALQTAAEAAPAEEPAASEPAPALPPPAPLTAVDLIAQLEAERQRREAAIEHATIRAIHRRAERPDTKEAVGERPLRPGLSRATAHRAALADRSEADRGDFGHARGETQRKWERSPRLDREAPHVAEHTAQEATRGEVPTRRPRAPERLPQPLSARDPREAVLGRRVIGELTTALGFYQAVDRLEQVADPAVRGAQLLAEQPDAVIVTTSPDLWRRVREQAEAAGQPVEVEGQPRVLQGHAAYEARYQRWHQWFKDAPHDTRHLPEPGVIPRAYVVTDEPWNSVPLTEALNVAAESHVVVPPLRPAMAQEVAAESYRLQAAMAARAAAQETDRAAQVREAAYERGAQASAAQAAQRAAERQAASPGAEPSATPSPQPSPGHERGGAQR
jgi:conjugative relaxase-like TrwC/TraI family protein